MPFPLETADSFDMRWKRADAEAAAAQYAHDVRRHEYPQDNRDRATVLRELLETADRYLLAGIWNEHQHDLFRHDVEEELALLERNGSA